MKSLNVLTQLQESLIAGRVAIPAGEALFFVGASSSIKAATKTARNQIHNKTYPFIYKKIGRTNVVRVAVLLEAVGVSEPETDPVPTQKQVGRPRKK
jgi:hypothetical protein